MFLCVLGFFLEITVKLKGKYLSDHFFTSEISFFTVKPKRYMRQKMKLSLNFMEILKKKAEYNFFHTFLDFPIGLKQYHD